jgi:sugar (pentulose or hexulose) kinase
MKEHILGIDAGTSSIKVAALTGEGGILGIKSGKTGITRKHPGWAEQDMNMVWDVTASCIRACLEDAGLKGEDIAVVCCAGQGDGAWMVDADGRPLGLAPLWCDNRAASIIEKWGEDGILAEVYSKNTSMLWPGSLAGIMAWHRDNDREILKKLHKAMCCKDWINYCLTGNIATDTTDGTIPFSSIKDRRLDEEILSLLELDFLNDKLPPIKKSSSVLGEVIPQAAALSGLARGTPVVIGCLDVAANAVGAGVVEPGQALLIVGTTSLLAADIDKPPEDNHNMGASLIHAVEDQWLRVFGAQSGTPNVDWMGSAFNIFKKDDKNAIDFIEMDRLIGSAPAGSGGVLYHPFLSGERAPFLAPDASSSIFGISAGTGTGELCRSIYEGVAFSAKHCLSEMDASFNKIAMTGGGTRSDLWCRIIANVLNCDISIPRGEELGIIGAGIIGGVGIGFYKSYVEAVKNLVKESRRYSPEASENNRYEEIFPLYRELIDSMKGFWKKRASLLRKWDAEDTNG